MSDLSKKNLAAWCIVPFDACKRGPRERAEMLKRLGIRSLAYDWRKEHLPTFDDEIAELRERDLQMTAFYLICQWPQSEAAAEQDTLLLKSLAFLKRSSLEIDIWITYAGEGTRETDPDEDRYASGARRVDVLARILHSQGCRLGIYNHGGWGGLPATMVEIVKRVESPNVGIVYNFHHGHDHMADMPDALNLMRPHLIGLNLNGTTAGGPKILPIGQGEEDRRIIQMVADLDYDGPIGILDHRPDTDAEESLKANLSGLHSLLADLGHKDEAETYL
jgi:sugar phosphate isomerase/epimerase